MLLDQFTSVMQVKSRAEFATEVVSFARRLGFLTVDAFAAFDGAPGGEPEFVGVHNAPERFDLMRDTKTYARFDPVMQHCKHSCLPLVWDRNTYVAVGKLGAWEMQASFGYRTGIAYALHLPRGRHFFVGVDRDQALPACKKEVTRMTAELQLFAVHALEVAMQVLLPGTSPSSESNLTPRELESLRWTMEGKTAWEIGMILGISEQTAARHLSNATRKLDCVSKHQAVVRALRLELIR
jgi:DNA-binding CsgD family transcriptional regulator